MDFFHVHATLQHAKQNGIKLYLTISAWLTSSHVLAEMEQITRILQPQNGRAKASHNHFHNNFFIAFMNGSRASQVYIPRIPVIFCPLMMETTTIKDHQQQRTTKYKTARTRRRIPWRLRQKWRGLITQAPIHHRVCKDTTTTQHAEYPNSQHDTAGKTSKLSSSRCDTVGHQFK